MNATGQGSKRVSTMRKVGWLSVTCMLALALLAPAANAEEGNQSGDGIAWDEATPLCTGGPDGAIVAGPGEVAWVFVHSQQAGPGQLTATFLSAGEITVDSYVQGGLKYIIWTGPDTLDTFSDNLDGGVLTLSHVCAGTTTTTTTSSSTSSTTSSTTTETSSTTSTTTESTTTMSTTTSTSSTGTQSVAAITDPPVITNPPSDTVGGDRAMGTGSAWRLLLIGLAGLLASLLVLTPERVTRRR